LAATCAGALLAGAAGLAPMQALQPVQAAASGAVHGGTIVALDANQSVNWSGYGQFGSRYHSITADWVVPTASPHRGGESEYSATWAGIGGGCLNAQCSQTDSTLIQAGTDQDVVYDLLGGTTTSYSAWYELIPNGAVSISPSDLPVAPGDSMHLDIHENGSGSQNWTISLENVTQQRTFSTSANYQSSYATAEWVEESPTVVAVQVPPTLGSSPLPDLSTVTFDLASTNGTGANLAPSQQIEMKDTSGNVVATPSAPDAEADGFDLCTYSSTCPPTGPSGSQSGGGLFGGLIGLAGTPGALDLGPLAGLITCFAGI
jgi:hypothetical protein